MLECIASGLKMGGVPPMKQFGHIWIALDIFWTYFGHIWTPQVKKIYSLRTQPIVSEGGGPFAYHTMCALLKRQLDFHQPFEGQGSMKLASQTAHVRSSPSSVRSGGAAELDMLIYLGRYIQEFDGGAWNWNWK